MAVYLSPVGLSAAQVPNRVSLLATYKERLCRRICENSTNQPEALVTYKTGTPIFNGTTVFVPVIATEKSGLLHDIEILNNASDQFLTNVDNLIEHHKMVKEKATALLSDLNPVYKEKQETEKRFNSIEERFNKFENKVDGMSKMLENFIKKMES
jgi:hypothetical protein